MTTVLQFSINPSAFNNLRRHFCRNPITYYCLSTPKFGSFQRNSCKLRTFVEERRWCLFERGKDGILLKEDGFKSKKKRVILVRFNQGFGGWGCGRDNNNGFKSKKKRVVLVRFNQGFGGGGGGRDNSNNARILGNLALAILLTYLSMTGQLGWVLDAIVSIWLLVVIIPIVGLGAFLWWAGRDMVQGTCPNCGKDFQIFKSTLNDELQLCPYCSQPFSVEDDKFVRESVRFSNESTTFGEAFGNFFPGSKKGKESSGSIVDVEAEIKDAD